MAGARDSAARRSAADAPRPAPGRARAGAPDEPPSPEHRALSALEASGVAFTITRHGPVSSLAEAAAARGLEPGRLLKTLVVRRGEDDFVLVLVPGDRQLSWPRLRRALGVSRLSLPDKEVARAVTGYERGTITPFGSLRPWPVVADSRVAGAGHVSVGAGAHGVAATLDADALITALGARVEDVTNPGE
ncbi:YbaK/EbsC family protein [Xylanimonas allomyrinae]|uniref:YbaK/EbsC family protein n=1 Tax=Xylanimonas allomyrinae TaxID=2509459 RepID=A0A4P6F138_9MICO|nr:YbaK/EbsC family protein [Xylanimonas allomyrinae]QAY64048.1 YbaK/EbsC family protein [Xylanimonas allomyrinae]